jgi:putative ABC transport system permease protein
MTGVHPVVGRAFRPDEDRFGADRAVVIGFELWRRHYGSAADVVGRSIRIDNEPYQIIGVAPRGFIYPTRNVQLWLPLLATVPPQQQIRHDLHYLKVAGRLRSGVSMQQAQAEVDAISARYKAAHPQEATGEGAVVVPLHDDLTSYVRRPVTILFAAVMCVLLIACLNIANLMLTRAVTRTREIGIRTALGASRLRIIRQLVTESVLLGLASGSPARPSLSGSPACSRHARRAPKRCWWRGHPQSIFGSSCLR